MRQLPGKTAKENRKMKRERKKYNLEGKNKALKIAVPILLGLFGLVIAYVYTAASKH
jgi:cell division septal protein FtsQ